MDNEWTDCSRSTCCPDFTYVAGRCVPNDVNPCQLNLCEQRCSVFFGRVVCTCFAGFDFNREKHLQSTPDAPVKACEDINECDTNNGDCEQVSTTIPDLHMYHRMLFYCDFIFVLCRFVSMKSGPIIANVKWASNSTLITRLVRTKISRPIDLPLIP